MSEISVKYADLAHGSTTANTLHSKLDEVNSNFSTAKSKLSEEIFMGPIATNTKEAIDSLIKQMESALEGVKLVHNLLNEVNDKYKSSDYDAIKDLLQITNGDTSTTDTNTAKSSNSAIQSALDWAIGIANDNSYGYSQSTRWGNPNYDCSSLVISAYEQAGIKVKTAGANSTRDMKQAFIKCGFEWIPGDPKKTGLTLQPGDVLLKVGSHTEMYVGNGKNVGAHANYDKRNGDSKGNEINVRASNHPWDGVLRLKKT